jgi:hypothetical protein
MSTARTYRVFIRIALGAFFLAGLLARCAQVGYPEGGPRDSLPPRIVTMLPEHGTTNFTGKRIYIEFDEYVVLKDQQKEFFISPPGGKIPGISLRGRGVQIDIRDTLLENQTYSLNFGGMIRDNNESNHLYDFRFVFSTGPEIDSMFMSGYTVDAYTRDSVPQSFIFFYPAHIDSMPQWDSTLFRNPAAAARAQPNGLFTAENLKPVDYRVYALDDRNGNRTYEPGTDRVGFLDSVYNPALMPPFTIRYDTSRKYNVPEPQLYFRMFMDKGFKRQYLVDSERPVQHRAILDFNADYPVITELTLDGIDSTRIITQHLKPTLDSISLWLHVPSEELPDTIKGRIIYLRHDSLSVLRPDTVKLALAWKAFEQRKRDRNDTLPEPNPFKYKVDASQELNPYKNIPITFDYPIVEMDSAAVSLTRVEGEGADEKRLPARFNFIQDTVDMMRWTLSSQWVPNAKYELLVPAGAFTDVAGQKNDTLRAAFTVKPVEKFATLELNIKGKTPESEYVIQILGQGNAPEREYRHVRTGKLEVPYLEPGTVRIRVIEDINGNGQWDGGDLIKRMQPERTELFLTEKGEPEIENKENWALEFDLDMNEMFAPLTMDHVVRQLREMEVARIQKLLKERAKQAAQPRPASNQRTGQQPGGMGGGMGGGFPMPQGMGGF